MLRAAPQEWTTAALTEDLMGKLRADLFLVAREATLRASTGQRADVLAMRRKLANGPMLIFEIKTSRGDLLGDLKREKWRGYLADGAVAFAFPAGLADPREIPPEAGVIVRIAQGWSWKRAPRWSDAPLPTPYLLRRMALTASDQAGARARQELAPKAADLWRVQRAARTDLGRRLARIAHDIDLWEGILASTKAQVDEVSEQRRGLESKVADLERMRFSLEHIRSRECAEVLFEDFRDRLNPQQYERVLAGKRGPIHPLAASALLRLFTEIAGERAA